MTLAPASATADASLGTEISVSLHSNASVSGIDTSLDTGADVGNRLVTASKTDTSTHIDPDCTW